MHCNILRYSLEAPANFTGIRGHTDNLYVRSLNTFTIVYLSPVSANVVPVGCIKYYGCLFKVGLSIVFMISGCPTYIN